MKKQTKNILITTIVCLILNILTMVYEASNMSFQENTLRIISDGFFVSGVFILIVATITYVSNEGGLYFMDYIGHRLRFTLTKQGKAMHYYEFVDMKKEAGKLNVSHLFIVSILSILISLIIALL